MGTGLIITIAQAKVSRKPPPQAVETAPAPGGYAAKPACAGSPTHPCRRGVCTCSAAFQAAQRWPAGPVAWRAHVRPGAAVAAKMAALQVGVRAGAAVAARMAALPVGGGTGLSKSPSGVRRLAAEGRAWRLRHQACRRRLPPPQ
ncbi:MAG TPA: hypothetical protein VH599_16920 [Ktedonobacterales bacterium]